MKKIIIYIISCLVLVFITGCSTNNGNADDHINNNLTGVLILQVYGIGESGGSNDPALSHSFIELYNNTSEDILLTGSSLQYSEGGTEWEMLELDGTIKANSSFLVTANTYDSYTISKINDGDQKWDIVINNKSIKVCLLNNASLLQVINPYNVSGVKIDGYIDMVCTAGNGETNDAAETMYITGQSKQKAVRRTSLTDTNNNSNDFELVDYSTLSPTNIKYNLPKNQENGTNNPFEIIETNNDIIIFQVYGTGNNTDGALNRSFIELYNNSSNNIDLSDYQLHYISDGSTWTSLSLSGTIPAYSSFLILGLDKYNGFNHYGVLQDSDADMVCNFQIDNKTYTICLTSSNEYLGNSDPFDKYLSGTLNSYVDMVGVGSLFYEKYTAETPSKQKSIRRTSLIDTDNNSIDFEIISFNTTGNFDIYFPRSSSNGTWNPFN